MAVKALPPGCQVRVEQTNGRTVSGILIRADDSMVAVRVKKNKAPEIRKEAVATLEARPFKPAWGRSASEHGEIAPEPSSSSATVTWQREHTKYRSIYRKAGS